MTRNFDDLFAGWLEDGPTRASDRVLDGLLADLATTSQRNPPFFRPRRASAMTTFLKLGVAAAAVVAVAIAALSVTRAPGPSVGTSPTPAASPVVSAPASSAPAASAKLYRSAMLPYTLEIPAGWTGGTVESGDFEQWQRFNPLTIAFVGSTRPPDGVALDDYVAQAVDPESACPAQPPEVVETTMGGEPAFQIAYECDGRGYTLVATGHNGRRYVLGTEAADLDDALAALEAFLPTFTFTD